MAKILGQDIVTTEELKPILARLKAVEGSSNRLSLSTLLIGQVVGLIFTLAWVYFTHQQVFAH